MPDETFESLWNMPGGRELVGLHSLLSGTTVPVETLRDMLKLTREQFRAALWTASALGFIEGDDENLTFRLFSKDSGQQSRLDWCLEPHRTEFGPLQDRLRSQLLIRFLTLKPGRTG